eukprot:20562-Heterococcus_DN1.PRE.3
MTLYSSVFASPSRIKGANESGLGCTSDAYQRAAGKYADIVTLEAACELGMEYTALTVAGAAERNKLAEVQYLRSQGCPWPTKLLERAALRGHFELVRWCREHGCPWETDLAVRYAAHSGSTELMDWVLQQPDTHLTEEVMSVAASNGHTAMCKYLHAQQCPWDTSSTNSAARAGDVDLLTWLVNNGCPWEARKLCMSAAWSGSIDVLTYLQELGLLTSTALLTDMLDRAASGFIFNRLAAAKWLREQGAEWPMVFAYNPWRNKVLEWATAEGFTTATEY